MRPVPWHVKGVHPDARDAAREAARRSGVSVGAWLNSLIISAGPESDGTPAEPAAPPPPAQGFAAPRAPGSDHISAIGRQIDELKWRIDSLSRDDSARQVAVSAAAEELRSARLAEAIARIDRQLDRLSRKKRGGAIERDTDEGVDEALAEITARQHALEDEFAEPPLFDLPAAEARDRRSAEAPVQNAAVEKQLQDIAAQIKSLQGSMQIEGLAADLTRTIEEAPKKAVEGIEDQLTRLTGRIEAVQFAAPAEHLALLRNDIGEMGRNMAETVPQAAMTAIAEQVRGLTDEVSRLRPPSTDEITQTLRQEFAEIGKALRESMPQHAGSSLEEQMRVLTEEIGKLFPPVRTEEIAEALRKDLAEIAETLKNAVPAGALASLEQEVRDLGARVEANRASLTDQPVIAEIERSLADLRNRLDVMAPLGDVATLAETLRTLSQKADAIASQVAAPERLHQLDDAIGALRELATQIASPADIAALSHDVHALAEKIDGSARPQGDSSTIMTLDQRLAEMTAAFDSVKAETKGLPADLEAVFTKLTERLESVEVRCADQGALKNLEGRIVGLVEKLDASEERLSRLDGVERGVGDLLEQISALRVQNETKLQAIQQELIDNTTRAVSEPAEAIRRDVATLKELQSAIDRRTQDTFEAVYGTIEQVVDRLAVIEEDLRGRESPSAQVQTAERPVPALVGDAPALAPAAATQRDRLVIAMDEAGAKPGNPAPQPRQPIVPDLPPDAPLEPGSGGRRIRATANAGDRITASEAIAGATPAAADTDAAVRANFVAAARRAAQAVSGEQGPGSRFTVSPGEERKPAAPRGSFLRRFGPRIKTLIVAVSVAAIVLGTLRLAIDLFTAPNAADTTPPAAQTQGFEPSAPGSTPESPSQSASQPETDPIAPPALPANPPTPGKGAALGDGTRAAMGSTVAGAPGAPPAATAASVPSAPATLPASSPALEATGSTTRQPAPSVIEVPAPQPSAPASAPARDAGKDLPAAIGGKALIAAATAGDPAASYEVGARFADGTNVPQDLPLAAIWFDRAARSGIALAQFRLGSMYEKGVGLKKDLLEARRLYLAAADKGNAKAMHNLAVLYAEGLEGKPDYAVASRWFRKAAAFGLVDSQYNLAILYARGVGIERNLVESYKWFALAGKGGDQDAARKTLDIAAHLDESQLGAARAAVESFVAQNQPEDAISVKAPPGGWDQVVTAARKATPAAH